MPLVLAVSGSTESGLHYDDILGERYIFPRRYRKLILPGETVVFYTGKRAYPGSDPLSYLGIAIVGEIFPFSLPDGRSRMKSSFHYFKKFDAAVPFSIGGKYLESAANSMEYPSLHFRQGVRQLSIHDFHKIMSEAQTRSLNLKEDLEGHNRR